MNITKYEYTIYLNITQYEYTIYLNKYLNINTTRQLITQHFILYTIKIAYLSGRHVSTFIRSSSDTPRKQIQEVFMFQCIVGSQMLRNFVTRMCIT